MLVAAYLDYQPPASLDPQPAETSDAGPLTPPSWLDGGRGVAAPPELGAAQTAGEAIAAMERLFFGEVKDVRQL